VTVKPPGICADSLQVTMALPLPALAPGDQPAQRARASVLVEHAVVLGALLVLVGPVAYAAGGRDASAQAWLALATLAALAASRPWQRLTGRAWLLAPVAALAALFSLVATGGGRGAAVAAFSYVTAAGLLVSVAAYARTPARRAAVAGVLCVGGVAQFAWALVPWWGGADPAKAMVGTYFWHNQVAVALLLPALLGACLAVVGKRPWRAAGWIATPLCVAGVVLSTSRATLACLLVGWVLVVALSVVAAPNRRRALARAAVLTVVAAGLTFVLPGPPLFATHVSPLSGAAARASAGETVDANSTYRTEFWREALSVTKAHPFAGAGFGRLAAESAALTPSQWARSPLAHNGVLQAFADGGLPLGLPVLAGLVVAGAALVRGVRVRPRAGADAALVAAASVAGLALIAHSLVDTDWSFPALAGQFGVVVGLALAARTANEPGTEPARQLAASVGSAVLALTLVIGAAAAWGQEFHISATAATSAADAAPPARATQPAQPVFGEAHS
jgi:O-antigen ligase